MVQILNHSPLKCIFMAMKSKSRNNKANDCIHCSGGRHSGRLRSFLSEFFHSQFSFERCVSLSPHRQPLATRKCSSITNNLTAHDTIASSLLRLGTGSLICWLLISIECINRIRREFNLTFRLLSIASFELSMSGEV